MPDTLQRLSESRKRNTATLALSIRTACPDGQQHSSHAVRTPDSTAQTSIGPITADQRANDAAWLCAQLEQLERWMSTPGKEHRWPLPRVIRAVLAIRRGSADWCEAGCGDEGEVGQ